MDGSPCLLMLELCLLLVSSGLFKLLPFGGRHLGTNAITQTARSNELKIAEIVEWAE